ncbi:unnamed protein product [Ambrosiozyma monospora]|uniref:Unnamed protein product n=1 Tax=Ambrosiozyma monospora TaxID=43982 RepID=A0A9W7DIR5_AMBMO|nr:unnamed protein product [Ambrosiozyma monospora]
MKLFLDEHYYNTLEQETNNDPLTSSPPNDYTFETLNLSYHEFSKMIVLQAFGMAHGLTPDNPDTDIASPFDIGITQLERSPDDEIHIFVMAPQPLTSPLCSTPLVSYKHMLKLMVRHQQTLQTLESINEVRRGRLSQFHYLIVVPIFLDKGDVIMCLLNVQGRFVAFLDCNSGDRPENIHLALENVKKNIIRFTNYLCYFLKVDMNDAKFLDDPSMSVFDTSRNSMEQLINCDYRCITFGWRFSSLIQMFDGGILLEDLNLGVQDGQSEFKIANDLSEILMFRLEVP